MPNSIDLQNLHEIVMPAPVSWLPPAPGWYALGAIAALVLAWGALVWHGRRRRNAYRRQALAELSRVEAALDGQEAARSLARLPELLKRAALAAYGREAAASLNGKPWLDFLDRGLGKPLFSGENGDLLLLCAYGSPARLETISREQIGNLSRAVRAWLTGHRAVLGSVPQETRSPQTGGSS